MTGPTGPTGSTGPTGPTGPDFASTSFSGYISSLSGVSSSSQFTNFSVASPYFGNSAFNPTLGNFTAPANGRYDIEATINYSTTAALSVSLGSGINPAFVVRRTSPTTTDLITGLFPILNVNVALVLTLRAILGSGTVTLAGTVELNAGDVVGLFYVANGLTVGINLGGSGSGVVWSMYRIL